MKEFINRVREAYEYDWAWVNEPLFFKAFLVAFFIPMQVFKFIYAIVVGITFPLWIVPYVIWWKKKGGE